MVCTPADWYSLAGDASNLHTTRCTPVLKLETMNSACCDALIQYLRLTVKPETRLLMVTKECQHHANTAEMDGGVSGLTPQTELVLQVIMEHLVHPSVTCKHKLQQTKHAGSHDCC